VEPNRLSTILSYTDFIDWKQFIADKLGEDLGERYRGVKQAAPRAGATSHTAGIGLFSSPLWWEGQPDDWIMTRRVDYYGTSFYPKHSAFVDRDVEWRGALLDFTRSFGFGNGGRGFWIGELQAGFGTIALNVSSKVTPEDLRLWTWSALARGAKAICDYAWYPMSSGYESGGYGMVDLDGTITERSRVAGSIAQIVDRHQALFLAARPPRAEVAIVYNPLAYLVGGRQRETVYGGAQGEVAGIERDSMLGIYRALFPTNTPVDFIHIANLSAEVLEGYKLILLPYPLMIPQSAAARLRKYVEQGGTLVAEARLAWMSERGLASPRIPGMGLGEVMGCRETAVQTAAQSRTALKWTDHSLPGLQPGDELPGQWYEESLAPLGPQARIAARFLNGDGAAVISSYGHGKTLMLAASRSSSRTFLRGAPPMGGGHTAGYRRPSRHRSSLPRERPRHAGLRVPSQSGRHNTVCHTGRAPRVLRGLRPGRVQASRRDPIGPSPHPARADCAARRMGREARSALDDRMTPGKPHGKDVPMAIRAPGLGQYGDSTRVRRSVRRLSG
jgi:beta-galactosidase